MIYQEAVDWLYGTQLHGIRLGLENVRRLVAALGVRVDDPDGPRFIHVAGTNGKGSVCAMLDSILRSAGVRTGLFTSPHLVSFRERIRLDGEVIGETEVAARLSEIRELIDGWEHPPTFFEITTALALAHFQHKGAEIVVLETGMGGRLDATNIVLPLVSAITPIYLDHQQWLGATLLEIALEKAGIIKPGVPVVSAWQREEVLSVLGHVAIERESPFHVVVSPLGRLELGLIGAHQRWNAALAVHALEVAGLHIPEHAIVRGLREVHWPGRFQCVDDGMVLDGAHNPAAARQLAETWREAFGSEQATLIIGVLRDKDARGVLAALLPIAARVITVPVRSMRAHTAEELGEIVRELAPQLPCAAAVDLASALRVARATPELVLLTGSLFLVGEALARLAGDVMEVSLQ